MLPSTWHYEAIDSLSLRSSIRIRLAPSQPWSSSHNGNGAGRYEQVLLEVDVRSTNAPCELLRTPQGDLEGYFVPRPEYRVPSTPYLVLHTLLLNSAGGYGSLARSGWEQSPSPSPRSQSRMASSWTEIRTLQWFLARFPASASCCPPYIRGITSVWTLEVSSTSNLDFLLYRVAVSRSACSPWLIMTCPSSSSNSNSSSIMLLTLLRTLPSAQPDTQ